VHKFHRRIITFSDGGPDELPNLRPYQPAGWSDKIVASNIRKTNIDKQDFEPRDTIYIDFAVLNAGNAEPAENFEINLYVDDILRHTWNVPRLEANYYAPINDFSIGHLDVGSHEIKISVDSTKVIAETDEQDNEYTKRIVVVEPPLISIIEMLLLQD
jgi:subtilase family serine protease